ncbi:Na+/Ca+ antiporter [Dinoroseobacter shibae DFL 12 = DSM 16493]|jgi:cation:H+ antiporter|uniref:Na+/Ca+ antiporter n=1 Tax=Dinoroseobacter shibae (strain DSM 16493 / NCIMB 14021 / DFL 12) TaxID=398580 RepID=A8LQA2_DINSH|nr:calcium/sodium antiporter [Dinoroseobacter shibae]ABV92388.1 Na+/Ca+ antiporter [Dinoroseobacter shibae DFL 12 = DSM 16493]URF47334.1 calcium/sodium antiporter [Dinoroseobacter shibae]URF51645.1 calcium/sodium antiporter [Dinoroseobacter shibae]
MDFLLAGLGLVILVLAGDSLVKGAVNLSLRVGIPALIVSLTIVAFGTSAPELLISIAAVKDGAPGLALGNVVGSNTANILLVLGIPALLAGLHTADCDTRRSYVQMLAATILFIAVCFLGPITWMHGLVLLAALGWMLFDAFREAKAHKNALPEVEEVEGADPDMPWWRIVMFLFLGLVGLPLGADLLVDASINIARAFGISEEVIGLTLVAFGTSLPELATTVMASIRRQADVALGNVIGSNMFNLLAIIGITAMVGDIPVSAEFLTFDLWVMLGASLLLIPFVYFRVNLKRTAGVVLTGLYVAYVVALLT